MLKLECQDTYLWDSFRDSDPDAFSRIYNLHVQALYQYGSKLTPDTGFVMDCIHDLFVDLSNHRSTIGTTDNIRFYLIRSLTHRMIRAMKSHNKIRHDTIDDYPFLLEAAFDDTLDEQETTRKKRHYLRDALNELPYRQKEAIYLRYINNFNNEEIAQIMGINYQAVRNTLYKAIENLRKSISKEDFILFLMVLRPHQTLPFF
ncbi:MAG: sigma-70 family RNA polymerase sigma factor [Bacteroidales bacterium]|jgi:RNA polymerase sigma factor (sigma-70 family)|nr:sigma-70 family RNA polymerase sigma factor [Bacteroidales bacterium]